MLRSQSSIRFQALTVLLLWMFGMFSSAALADSWGPPRKEHWSENQMVVLKVSYPQNKQLSLWKKTEDGLKPLWNRGYIHRVWPPHRAYVTDDGQYVVLRDTHHSLGDGQVIVILGPKGQSLGSYALNDFLPVQDILAATQSVSSLWWDENAWFSLIQDDRRFALVTQQGTVRCFDLPTGKLLDLNKKQHSEIVGLVKQDAMKWVKSQEPQERIHGMTLLGALGLSDAVPIAKKLFEDRASTGSIGSSGKPKAEKHGVQMAAALALIRLLGADALPIIETELKTANWYMQEQLLDVVAKLDMQTYFLMEVPASSEIFAFWKRMADSPSEAIRGRAIFHVLLRDDGEYVKAHPKLIEHDGENLRRAVTEVLGRMKSSEAIPLLRKAINDPSKHNRQLALKYLIAHSPQDLKDVLLPLQKDEAAAIRLLANTGLAKVGVKTAVLELSQVIKAWSQTSEPKRKSWELTQEVELVCGLIIDLKLTDLQDNLKKIRPQLIPEHQSFVTGALAGLGNANELEKLHRMTESEDMATRLAALKMCGHLDDEKSNQFVEQTAESSKDVLVLVAQQVRQEAEQRRKRSLANSKSESSPMGQK